MIINKKFILFIIILLTSLLFSPSVSAFNHPEIEWKSVVTRHFVIHFYDKTEPAVYAAWKIAEEAYESFNSLYMFSYGNKIHLALADYDDFSNGFASWTDRSIMVWVPDSRFDLRSNTTWLRDVITHELAHIMSLERKRGVQLLDWSLGLQYMSPNVNVAYIEPVALTTFFPMWFAEGTAQLRAEQMGSDCWDSRRDMILRCAALNNTMLSLDEMGHFTHDIIGSEMVYNQGYAFTKYLETKIGKSKVAKIWNDNRGRLLFGTTVERYLRKNYNISLDDLCKTWKDSLKASYKSEVPEDLTKAMPVWEGGKINLVPRVSSDGRYWGWLTNHKDDFYRTDLIIANYGEKIPLVRIKYAKIDWDFSPDGTKVYYIKSRKPNKNGSYLNDIFSYDIQSGDEIRLTNSARIYDITASPNGKNLVCVQYNENAFSLMLFSLSDKRFTTIVEGTPGEPFLTTSCIPSDNNKLIVSKIVQGKAGLFGVETGKGVLEPLVSTEAQEESPCCGEDGRIYFSADYDGVFNIYSILPEGTELKRHTSVTGGAFSPEIDKNGKLLISEYTSNGFRIAQCPSGGVSYEPSITSACLFKLLPTPKGKVNIKEGKYDPKYLRGRWEILTSLSCFDNDRALQDLIRKGEVRDSVWNIFLDIEAGIGMTRSDAVGKRDMYIGGTVNILADWHEDDDKDTVDRRDSHEHLMRTSRNMSHARYNARPSFMRRQNKKLYGRISPALKRDLLLATMAYDSDDNTSDASESPISGPYLIPFFGAENRTLKPTIGFDAIAALVLLVPAVIYVDPYIEWHLARDLYFGISPSFLIRPGLLFSDGMAGFGMSSPVWIQWIYKRYSNEDIYYNKAGISSLNVFVGPDVIPVVEIEDTYDTSGSLSESDTTFETVVSLSFGLEFMHAFPLFKYASFTLSTQNYGLKFNKEVSGSIGRYYDSTSYDFLLTSSNRAAFKLPIIRNINRGRLYADNLYGSLFYQLDFAGTEEYFSEPKKDAFLDKKYSTDFASVSHLLGAGIEFGLIKNYMFMRKLKVEAAWDFFYEEFNFDLSWWF